MQRMIPVVARNKMGTNKMGTVPVWDATPNDEKQTPERQQGIVDFLMA